MTTFKPGDRVQVRRPEALAGRYFLGTYNQAARGGTHLVMRDNDPNHGPYRTSDEDIIHAPDVVKPLDIARSHADARLTDPRVLGWDKMIQIERERLAPEPQPIFVVDPSTKPGYISAYIDNDTVGPRLQAEWAARDSLGEPGPITVNTGGNVCHGVQYFETKDAYLVRVLGGEDQWIDASFAKTREFTGPTSIERQRVYRAVTAGALLNDRWEVWDTFCEVETRIEVARRAKSAADLMSYAREGDGSW